MDGAGRNGFFNGGLSYPFGVALIAESHTSGTANVRRIGYMYSIVHAGIWLRSFKKIIFETKCKKDPRRLIFRYCWGHRGPSPAKAS
jgi:hypothetical protein